MITSAPSGDVNSGNQDEVDFELLSAKRHKVQNFHSPIAYQVLNPPPFSPLPSPPLPLLPFPSPSSLPRFFSPRLPTYLPSPLAQLSSMEGSGNQDEIDFEFLGAKKDLVQLNVWVNGQMYPGSEVVVPLGFDCSQDFHTYAIYYPANQIV